MKISLSILIEQQLDELGATFSPAVMRLFQRARRTKNAEADLLQVASSILGYSADLPLPIARNMAKCEVVDQAESIWEEGSWLCIDPVYLHADLTSLILFSKKHFPLDEQHSQSLISLIRPLVEECGARFYCGERPERWFLRWPNRLEVQTFRLDQCDGQDIRDRQPTGTNRNTLIQLMSEIQMVLHDCQVNQQRQAIGHTPVNGVWLWGNGAEVMTESSSVDTLISDDLLLRSLATDQNVSIQQNSASSWSDQWRALQASGRQHALIDLRGERSVELIAKARNETSKSDQITQLMKALPEALSSGIVERAEVIFPDQTLHLTPYTRWRFWAKG